MKKRLRVFAGPNGSGKSSIIKSILDTKVGANRKLDFGIYVNADDIASDLRINCIDLSVYKITATLNDFHNIAEKSGLISSEFPINRLKECTSIKNNKLFVNKDKAQNKNDFAYERIAQIIADYLRFKLIEIGAKFSFETVFSHESKVDFIKFAKEKGYKVYLYFVSTEDPEINVYRVKIVRLGKDGHDVPEDKIRSRYYRSMDLLYEAAQYCYRTYFFDNSEDGTKHSLFASFNLNKFGKKIWDITDKTIIPNWFYKYYSNKVKK